VTCGQKLLSANGFSYVVTGGVVSNPVASVAGMDHSTDTPPDLAVAMRQVEADSRVLAAALANGAVRDLSHQELGELVATGRAVQARVDAVVLAAVGEVDARGSHLRDGALTAGAWLRSTVTVTPSEAAGAVRTARALRGGLLPGTVAALGAGEITARHAQAIADGIHTTSSRGHRGPAPVGAVALIEPEVLAVARTADTRAVGSVMAAFQHALDPDGADAAALRRFARRGLTLAAAPDRTTVITGLADESSAAVLLAAIDAASPLVAGDPRTPAQIRLDALVGICRQHLENPDAPTRGGGGHPHVIVTTDQATLFPADHPSVDPDGTGTTGRPPGAEQPARTGSPGATLAGIGRIPASTAQRLACDGELTTVLLDEQGAVSGVRTQRRYFTTSQRRAMIGRDGDRCPWPWCDRPATWSDGHHLVWASRSGPTTVANGALPCPGHHTMCHEGGWTLHRHPDGRYSATHRDGRTLGPEPHPPGHNRQPTSRPPPQQE
jgi:hypothetical protein